MANNNKLMTLPQALELVKQKATHVTAVPTKTQWFDGNKYVPGQPGVYETNDGTGVCYQLWTGNYWGYKSGTTFCITDKSADQNLPFRGFTTKQD